MNKLYIHVGPHKTGSTMIQKFLLDNRAELFKQNVVYPKRFLSIFGHHSLRQLIFDQSLSQDDIAFFNEPHDFIVSSEDFISLERKHWEYFQSVITNKQIVILHSWRRASLKLYSIWQETIKHGGTESFFSYYHDHLARPGQSQMLSADLKLNMFAHVFGKDNINIVDFDASAKNGDLLQQFFKAAQLSWNDEFVSVSHNKHARNASMGLADIEVIRAINCRLKAESIDVSSNVRSVYLKNIDTLNTLGLGELKALILSFSRAITVGNYFIDNRGEAVMVDKYKSNIVNYEPHTTLSKLNITSDEWSLTASAQKALNDISAFIRDKL
ncbi:hypothetical protein J3L16_00360 [Alteromonas sp. 5E99-2]|uniref:hypothetical protein n=1 Tax=Alteromonas sp. 5E99-2 TaxID=2817683 RepID=UPI001A98F857|nr:hypothetical protein [Alteromonas sp. 5E99-2]MBO1254129.1 hypothetical protein [Alteromonas sp. 5E99-2]